MNIQAHILSAATTKFGRRDNSTTLTLLAEAANDCLTMAGMERRDIDGVLCGYATTFPHLMLATLLSEKLGLNPAYAHGMQLGGATGAAMVMLARELILSGRCQHILVVAGENRLSGQSTDSSMQTLAQVGEADLEVPCGASVPTYYALLASEYMHRTGLTKADLAEFAVLMRHHASTHPHAHLQNAITVGDVLQSKPISSPLQLLDCCPISDGACAILVSARPGPVAVMGAGQAHQHQHLSRIGDIYDTGAAAAATRALTDAKISRKEIDYLGIYDSFTITLAILLEELGFAQRGQSANDVRHGRFSRDGPLPLNTHGGLLSFGHSGVAGGMAHIAETWTQLAGRANGRQIASKKQAFIHADGGVLSSHISLILRATGETA
ncbi:thiolase family protein [Advenella kashmirensis]